MNKKPSILFSRIKSALKIIIAYSALAIILGVIGYLAWLNHNDFEKAIVSQARQQLLITAISEAQSIEEHVSNPDMFISRSGELLKHINDVEKVYVFILDDNSKIICWPNADFVGKNILELAKGKIPEPERLKLDSAMRRIRNGGQGTETLGFFSEGRDPKIVKTLIAFTPAGIGENRYSVIVAMEYSVIAGPLNKNARDNLLFAGFIVLILIISGIIFYRIRRSKARLAISEATSNIINKQLHLEIEERKKRGR